MFDRKHAEDAHNSFDKIIASKATVRQSHNIRYEIRDAILTCNQKLT